MRVGQRPLQLYPELAVSAKSYNSRALDPTHKGIGISANSLNPAATMPGIIGAWC